MEDFYDDLTAAYRAEVADLAARGCRYLQFDDTNLAYLCDPEIRARTKARGDDPDALTRLYCRLVNDSIRDRPKDMTISVHLCRGNFKSAWVAQGGYEPVAEILLNEMKIDGFFLEYDDERSGDFAPLRFAPKSATIVLGLMSSKKAARRDKDEVKRRIEEATKYVPLEQCALSPPVRLLLDRPRQRPHRGRPVDQARRLVEIAEEVWGEGIAAHNETNGSKEMLERVRTRRKSGLVSHRQMLHRRPMGRPVDRARPCRSKTPRAASRSARSRAARRRTSTPRSRRPSARLPATGES